MTFIYINYSAKGSSLDQRVVTGLETLAPKGEGIFFIIIFFFRVSKNFLFTLSCSDQQTKGMDLFTINIMSPIKLLKMNGEAC